MRLHNPRKLALAATISKLRDHVDETRKALDFALEKHTSAHAALSVALAEMDRLNAIDSTQAAYEAREHMEECISKPGGRG